MAIRRAAAKTRRVNWRFALTMLVAVPLGLFLLVLFGMQPAFAQLTHMAGSKSAHGLSNALVLRFAVISAVFGAIAIGGMILDISTD